MLRPPDRAVKQKASAARPATPDEAFDLAAALGRLALDPRRGDVFGALAYWLTLSRPPEVAHVQAIAAAIASGHATRRDIVLQFVESAEFREYAVIEGLLRDARANGVPFDAPGPVAPGTTERAVEIPWVLSRYRHEPRVLDVGYAHALPVYLLALQDLAAPVVHGVDLAAADAAGIVRARADVRALPYRDAAFDLVLCVSSLEHVGYDNAAYGTPQIWQPEGDVQALEEMRRVLRPGGRLLVTVPFGRRERHAGFHQYDAAEWAGLVGRSELEIEERAAFRLTDEGWQREHDLDAMPDVAYADVSARGVLCAALRKVASP